MAPVVHDLRPDVVVGSSISRLGWRKIRTVCDAQRIATILYIREMLAMNSISNSAIESLTRSRRTQ